MLLTMKLDVDLHRDVIDELKWDPEIAPEDIRVMVDDGVVTLTGSVTSFVQCWAAERAVRRITGVRAIVNDIKVPAAHGGALNDTEIAKGIADAFEHNVLIPSGITIRVTEGGVTLGGTVVWNYQRTAAEASARSIHDVKWVSSMITVTQPTVEAATIERGITQALVRNATVDAHEIRVVVNDGQVTLTGEVRSLVESQEAEAAAWRGTGVTNVMNHLRVVVPR